MNSAGQLDTTCSQVLSTTKIIQFNSHGSYIRSLEGIKYFKNLDTLEINYCNRLTAVPLLPSSIRYLSFYSSGGEATFFASPMPSNLQYLDISYMGQLTSLPELPANLSYFDAASTYCLSSATTLPASLKIFKCSGASFSDGSLPALPSSLENLFCPGITITSLPVIPASVRFLNVAGCYQLQTIQGLPAGLTYLNCSGCTSLQSIESLANTSIQFFSCSRSTNLSSIPLLPNVLRYFECYGCANITSLPPLPDSLRGLYAGGLPALTNLPSIPQHLDSLQCYYSGLTTLPALNNSLTYLGVFDNNLSGLPVLPPTLQTLICGNNPITFLPGLPGNLLSLNCEETNIRSLPELPPLLEYLHIAECYLTTLPALPLSLNTLYCYSNYITRLPDLPASLRRLDCSRNRLSSLPALPDTMAELVCNYNDNLLCLPRLPRFGKLSDFGTTSSFRLLIDTSKIKCIPNVPQATYLTMNPAAMPLCNPLNNIYQCTAFPQIEGNTFMDTNNNGVFDSGEQPRRNVKVKLSNSSYTFSDGNGHYVMGTDTTGTWQVSATAPDYFSAIPLSYSYNFLRSDTVATGNFALAVASIADELTVKLTPINWAARPGFSFPYMISYENTGSTTLSPDITFDYNQASLDYNTSSVSGVIDNTSTLSYNTGSLAPGQSGSFIGYFTLKTTVPLSDTLYAKATISTTAFTAHDSVQTIVRGAFDPNDKQATPQLSPAQVANGKYIDYTIRFQNTGTDTAFNVVLSDTLNENLQANTLEMLVASHTCKTTVKDNIVFFEFLNILLPDSNINEKASHGFASFRIKPQTTVAPNTTIPNKAAIYFDYNAPVITNTAGTLIKDFTVIPLKLISFSAVPQTDNTTTLYWNTANEINTKHFTIEQSIDGVKFNPIRNVPAKQKATNAYSANVPDAGNSFVYYRLKIVDKDGTFAFSPIIKIDRRKNTAGIAILTNPVRDFIVISTSDRALYNTQASIINTNGAVVKNFAIKQGSQTIEVKGLPTGVYYLRTAYGSSRVVIR